MFKFAALFLFTTLAWTQAPPQPVRSRTFDAGASSPEPDVYVPLTQRDRLAHYAQTTFGPPTLLVQPFLAAFTYATDPVPEWATVHPDMANSSASRC